MQRMNGPKNYYSSNFYNLDEGRGDIDEIHLRRTWRQLAYWVSDTELSFGAPATLSDGSTIRNEWLYVGRTQSGSLVVADVSIIGSDANYFSASFDTTKTTISQNGHLQIKVTFRSQDPVDISSLEASVQIHLQGYGVQTIPIVAEDEYSVT